MAPRRENRTTRVARVRLRLALGAGCFVLATGAVWNIRTSSPFVTVNAAEALYTSALYFALRAWWSRVPAIVPAVLSIGLAYVLDFSELYRSSWLDRERKSWLVRLVASDSLELLDAARLTLGVGVAFFVDLLVVGRLRVRSRR